jgi:hypothetical protein
MYLGDKGNALKCFFIAEHELMNFPNAQLSNELSDLEQEISKAGTDIAEMRTRLTGKT